MLQRQGALVELLEQYANIDVAVGHGKAFASLNRLEDMQSLEIASQTLLRLCLLKIISSNHEVRVSSLDAGSAIIRFSASDISNICLFALVLVPEAVIEAGNCS
jgi:hypothetical protein